MVWGLRWRRNDLCLYKVTEPAESKQMFFFLVGRIIFCFCILIGRTKRITIWMLPSERDCPHFVCRVFEERIWQGAGIVHEPDVSGGLFHIRFLCTFAACYKQTVIQ